MALCTELILYTAMSIVSDACVSCGGIEWRTIQNHHIAYWTGSVNRFDGRTCAKRRGVQQPGLGWETKPATASSHIFWILKAFPLKFSKHGQKTVTNVEHFRTTCA